METYKREFDRIKRLSDNLAGEVAEARQFEYDRNNVGSFSPMQKRLNSIFISIENEYSREIRSNEKVQNELAHKNSLLQKKVVTLNKLLVDAKEGLQELVREREKYRVAGLRHKKNVQTLEIEAKLHKRQKKCMELDIERVQEQMEVIQESSEVVHFILFFHVFSFHFFLEIIYYLLLHFLLSLGIFKYL